MCLIMILFSKLRVYCSKETKTPISSHLSTLFGTKVRLPIYQMELHSIVCKIKFPPNDNSLLPYKFTHWVFLEVIFPAVFLSASVLLIYTRNSFDNH